MQEAESIPVSMISEGSDASAEAKAGTPLIGAGQRIQDEGEACVFAESEQHENDTKKENEMIDVHAPHGGLHTWRDFWIHLGTIALGLLIALGLEQGVEYLHHLHQRHQLEASLLAECRINKDRAEANFSGFDDLMKWLLGLHRDIGKMLATGGNADLPYRQLHYRPRLQEGVITTGSPGSLVTSVWDTANADDRLALLPDNEAHAYSLLYHVQIAHYEELFTSTRDATTRQRAFEAQFADTATPTTPVLKRLSGAELKQYDVLVMQSFAAVRGAKAGLRLVYGNNNAVILGLYDAGSRQRTYDAAQAAGADDFARMAREIDAEDAARDKGPPKVGTNGRR